MRWWRRKHDPADEALAETRREREIAQARGVEIRSIVKRLREERHVNHLAERVRNALGEN